MADKIIAPLAMLIFLVFMLFLAVYINEVDLWIVIGIVSALAAFDFWHSLRQSTAGPASSNHRETH